jgi:hypothetical protein
MHNPVTVEEGTHTVHLYPYLYVVFRWMRGAVSLFVSSAARKENKRADAVRMQRNQHFPTEPTFNELDRHVWDRESDRMQRWWKNGVRTRDITGIMGAWRSLLLIINSREVV